MRRYCRPEVGWDVEELARRALMSRTAFATQFTDLVGEPLLRYVARCRINRAAQLPRSSDATIARIAESVGYDSRAFKRMAGLSPAAFRHSHDGSASAATSKSSFPPQNGVTVAI